MKKLSLEVLLLICVVLAIVISFVFGLIPALIVPIVFICFYKMYNMTFINMFKFSLFVWFAIVVGLVIRCAGFKWSTYFGFLS